MAEIPESLLRRSAEAKAKELGLPVEQVLAEMKGEAPPTPPMAETPAEAPPVADEAPAEAEEQVVTEEPESLSAGPETKVPLEEELRAEEPEAPVTEETPAEVPEAATEVVAEKELVAVGAGSLPEAPVSETPSPEAPTVPEAPVEAPEVETPAPEAPPNGAPPNGNGRRASLVSTRPVVPATGTPEGVRTQRLLTVVKARAIQQVKTEPTDKVNTWPHLMLAEFSALLAVTGVLVILSIILQAPLLDPANFNATPNPSKAPWYFLGLQELLSYFDPQIAGVTVPTIVGLIGFMAIPYVDRNPSTRPSDRKFAIMLYTLFMAGSATLTIVGVLFRGLGFNFAYPWNDGVFFDDIKDWVSFE
ncbi:MAG: hypothetical protein ACR2ME_10950 [Acidimicrobiia bacterium]